MNIKSYITFLLLICSLSASAQQKHIMQEVMQTEHISKYSLVYNDQVVYDNSPINVKTLSDTVYLQYDRQNSHTYISNEAYYFSSFQAIWISDYFAKLPIVPGTYNMITDMRNASWDYHILIHEEVQVNNGDTLVFSISEAENEIVLMAKDENGINFEDLDGSAGKYFSFVFPEEDLLLSSSYSVPQYRNIHCNDFSDQFLLYSSSMYYDLYDDHKVNLALFDPLYGVENSITFEFEPENYYKEDIQVNFKDGEGSTRLGIFHVREIILDGIWYLSKAGSQKEIDGTSWEGRFYVSPNQAENYAHAWLPGMFIESSTYPYYFGEAFDVYNDSVRLGYGTQVPNWVMQAENGFYKIGKGAVVPNFIYDNSMTNNNRWKVYFGANTNYFGINNEERREDQLLAPYTIVDMDGNIIEEGILGDFDFLNTEVGFYKFGVTNNNYLVGQRTGRSIYEAEIRLGNQDGNPPSLFCFQTLGEDGLPYDVLRKDEESNLLFAVSDYYWIDEDEHWYPLRLKDLLIDSTALFIKHEDQANWEQLDIEYFYQDTINGAYFRADLSEYTHADTGYYEVNIRFCDPSFNKVNYTLSPAFGISDEFVGINWGSEQEKEKFFTCYPNPFVDEINVRIFDSIQSDAKIKLFNHQGKIIATKNPEKQDCLLQLSNELPKGIYYLKLTNGNKSSIQKLLKL